MRQTCRVTSRRLVRVAAVVAGLTVLVITHDEGVAARARRRVGIVDGQLSELA